MDASGIIDSKMNELSKKIDTNIVFYDENKPKSRKKIDRRKLNNLAKKLRGSLVYAE